MENQLPSNPTIKDISNLILSSFITNHWAVLTIDSPHCGINTVILDLISYFHKSKTAFLDWFWTIGTIKPRVLKRALSRDELHGLFDFQALSFSHNSCYLTCNVFILVEVDCIIHSLSFTVYSAWRFCYPQLWWVTQRGFFSTVVHEYLLSKFHHSRQMGLLQGNFLESFWWIADVRALHINARRCWKCSTSNGAVCSVALSASCSSAERALAILPCVTEALIHFGKNGKYFGRGASRCIFSRQGRDGQLTVAMQQ